MFRTNFTRVLERLAQLEKRLESIESAQAESLSLLQSIRAELSQNDEVERLKLERQRLADQGLQLVQQLEAARRELGEARSE